MTGKEALEELVAGLDGLAGGIWTVDGPKHSLIVYTEAGDRICFMTSDGANTEHAAHIARCSPDRIRSIATYVATLEARAIAAEERVKRLEEEAKTPMTWDVEFECAPDEDGIDSASFMFSKREEFEAFTKAMKGRVISIFERTCVTAEDAIERAALAGGKPKTERPTLNDSLTILRRLADGDTVVYSQDGDMGWFTKGDRAFVGDKITTLRACGFIKCKIDPTDETDNYRGMAEYDTISDLGRRYLKEQSR